MSFSLSLSPLSVLFDDDYNNIVFLMVLFGIWFSFFFHLIEIVFIVCRFICSFVIVLVFGFRIGLIHFIP